MTSAKMTPMQLADFTLTCTRCGHHWLPRMSQRPKCCAKCNSPYWDTIPTRKRPVTVQPDAPVTVAAAKAPRLVKSKPSPLVITAAFAAFWAAYPRKTGKGKAWKAFVALKPTEALIGAILDALQWQTTQPKWLEQGGKFIPYPATWLNAHCWLDEPFHVEPVKKAKAVIFWYAECKREHFGACANEAAHIERCAAESQVTP